MRHHYIPETDFPVKLDDRVFMLGNYFFNLFLVIGNHRSALFETGISGGVDRVIHQLEHLGITPDYIICSHPHSDHITGLPGLMTRYSNADFFAAEGAAEFLAHPKAAPLLIKEDAFMSKRLADFGIDPGRPPLEKMPDLGRSKTITRKKRLDLGGISLDLLKVCGHSPGNLLGIIRDKKILFCSDSLGFHFPGRTFLPLFFTDADTYVDTLRFISDASPSIICPAHQGFLRGDKARKGIRSAVDTTIDLIKRINAWDKPEDDLVRQLFAQNYKDEFTLYTRENIKNCAALLVKRARQAKVRSGNPSETKKTTSSSK